jgi:hypothetical protein
MALGTATIWLSATAFECVEGAWQKRFSFEEDLLELPDVLSDVKQLSAEGAERLGHDASPRTRAVCLYLTIHNNLQMSRA